MGLLQKAAETYDAMAHRIGEINEGEKEPLAPVSHTITRAQIEITLDQDGCFLTARALGKDDPKIIIPVTEESAGRTSAPCAHPLCEQLAYLAPGDPKKAGLYEKGLADWAASPYSHPKLMPVLSYVRGGTILSDLARSGVIRLDQNGRPEDEKWMVRWIVNGLGEEGSGGCWEDRSLMEAYTRYYAAKQGDTAPVLCMISGEEEAPASQHPKGIVAANGNAKLISANDSSGFTYRGRFSDPAQAATVGYTASQKAHNALRWLIANQGVSFGGRTFLCWNPQGIQPPPVTGFMNRGSARQRAASPTQYRKQLKEALSGWKERLSNISAKSGVVIAAFDAATTGRLAVAYYNELRASDYLDRLYHWENTCCWEGRSRDDGWCPSLYSLVNWSFGTLRNGRPETDERILGQQFQRLVACRVDCAPFPLDMKRALVERASSLQSCKGRSPEDTGKLRSELLFTACAAIRKYYIDYKKEEWDMALDKDCTDRSYLFGRLLAIADGVERSTYKKGEERETNALRMQKAFSLRPLSTWRILEEKLGPYYRQLKRTSPGLEQYFRKLTQEITDRLPASGNGLNQKLEDIYLLGYYHQRAYRAEKEDPEELEE